ncbi:MAG: DUF488 family protein [Coriobacteriia bacterium]|nr:DUF488 family protein [Coriobacteriia bacterium]
MSLQVKYLHEPVVETDGKRILVDREWPADITPQEAEMHSWYKDVGPSNDLLDWYGDDPSRFSEYKEKYVSELDGNPLVQAEITQIRELSKSDKVTLLHAAKDPVMNNAAILKEYLEAKM